MLKMDEKSILKLKNHMKMQINSLDKSRFLLCRRLFIFILMTILLSSMICLIAYSYMLENVGLSSGVMTFFLCLLADIYYILKGISPNTANILKALIAVVILTLIIVFGVLVTTAEDSQQIEISANFLSVLIGFFTGVIIAKIIRNVFN